MFRTVQWGRSLRVGPGGWPGGGGVTSYQFAPEILSIDTAVCTDHSPGTSGRVRWVIGWEKELVPLSLVAERRKLYPVALCRLEQVQYGSSPWYTGRNP